ncbi:MAG: helix-turn-helix transcriptional regulator [Rhodospirillales bacterium]|nr:helix-turn-helix transcriptional regulator [Rhodospirillales bacterium]
MRVTNHLDAEIGRRLRQARLVENLTQDGLAQKLGISFQQVQKYENGTNRVSSSRLWAVSRVLGLPITYFYEGLDDSHITEAVEGADDGALPDRAIRVARMLNEMPDGEVKDKVYGLIKAFSKAS